MQEKTDKDTSNEPERNDGKLNNYKKLQIGLAIYFVFAGAMRLFFGLIDWQLAGFIGLAFIFYNWSKNSKA